mmetsp:Transcript_39226/g.59831  ORF Transcript_39226/g.59831 Transcript_39226/m.59831 type:complete len:218 (-) Transcript_39226:5558-6211(-)
MSQGLEGFLMAGSFKQAQDQFLEEVHREYNTLGFTGADLAERRKHMVEHLSVLDNVAVLHHEEGGVQFEHSQRQGQVGELRTFFVRWVKDAPSVKFKDALHYVQDLGEHLLKLTLGDLFNLLVEVQVHKVHQVAKHEFAKTGRVIDRLLSDQTTLLPADYGNGRFDDASNAIVALWALALADQVTQLALQIIVEAVHQLRAPQRRPSAVQDRDDPSG